MWVRPAARRGRLSCQHFVDLGLDVRLAHVLVLDAAVLVLHAVGLGLGRLALLLHLKIVNTATRRKIAVGLFVSSCVRACVRAFALMTTRSEYPARILHPGPLRAPAW